MNKKVIIIGAGGHGKVICDIVRSANDFVVGFLDDAFVDKKEFYGSFVLGNTDDYSRYVNECEFIVAIGNNKVRKGIAEKLECNWYTAIHKSAQISPSSVIGEGSCVMPNAVVNADAVIGRHCILNSGSVVEHDCKVGNYTHIAPKSTICGVTSIGNNCFIGAGSTVINCMHICDDVILGAGAAVVDDISLPGTYVGVPATKRNEK